METIGSENLQQTWQKGMMAVWNKLKGVLSLTNLG